MVQVFNKRVVGESTDAVYVGRPTPWGNRFVIGKDGNRQQVLRKYQDWLLGEDRAWFRRQVRETLKGHDLLCWCAPEACHADLLLKVANGNEMEPTEEVVVSQDISASSNTMIAVTGHRPPKLGLTYKADGLVDARVRKAIRMGLAGETNPILITGMALGIDMLAAEAAVEAEVPFIAAVPFPDQDGRWPEASRDRYHGLLDAAWDVTFVSDRYSPDAFQRRNEWMVRHSQVLMAFWDGSPGGTANCVKFAQGPTNLAIKPDYRIDFYQQKGN